MTAIDSCEEYEYDKNGNLINACNRNGVGITYEYDENNRITKVTNQSANLYSLRDTTYPTFEFTYEYYHNGFEKSKTDFNGTVEYEYDLVGRLKTVSDNATGATREYEYDKAGNRTKLTETFAEGKSGNATFMGNSIDYVSRITEYEYSVVNTLKNAEDSYTTNTNGVATRITTYEYDKAGNEISHRASYATSGELAFGIADGKDGGVIDGSIEYTLNEYDALNRLVYVNSVKNTNCDEATYTYNGDGLRVQSQVKGVSTNYQDAVKYKQFGDVSLSA